MSGQTNVNKEEAKKLNSLIDSVTSKIYRIKKPLDSANIINNTKEDDNRKRNDDILFIEFELFVNL